MRHLLDLYVGNFSIEQYTLGQEHASTTKHPSFMLGIHYHKLFKGGHKRNAGFNEKQKMKEAVKLY